MKFLTAVEASVLACRHSGKTINSDGTIAVEASVLACRHSKHLLRLRGRIAVEASVLACRHSAAGQLFISQLLWKHPFWHVGTALKVNLFIFPTLWKHPFWHVGTAKDMLKLTSLIAVKLMVVPFTTTMPRNQYFIIDFGVSIQVLKQQIDDCKHGEYKHYFKH